MVIRQLKNKSKKFIKSKSGFIPILALTLITAFTTLSLRSIPSSADPQKVASSVTVASSCSFTGVEDSAHPHQVEMLNGQHFTGDKTGYTTLSTFCNDANGYNIYAQGCTVEDEDGNCATTGENTRMIDENNDNAETNYIATGVYPDVLLASTPSSWAMTLIPGTSGQVPEIVPDYKDRYNVIPTASTLVASYPATTTGKYKTSSTLTTNYEIYISQTQPSGTYVGKVKYTMVTVPAILAQAYIQDINLSTCAVNVGTNGNSANIGDNITVADIRDGNLYTIRYINGQCWMTKNLNFTGTTLYPDTSNVSETTTITYYDLDGTEGSSEDGHCHGDDSSGSSYNYACIHSGNDPSGNEATWYNFAAASAATVTGASNSNPPTGDVCPIGWRLPTGPNTATGTDINKLAGNNSSGSLLPTAGLVAFGYISGGRYANGALVDTGNGYWTASTTYNSATRYRLRYYGNDMLYGNGYGFRDNGFYIRCVLDDRTLSDITYMQEVTPAIVKNTAEGAEATLTDLRTYSNGLSNTYTVKKINGELWMTQNLRITGTISAQYSNFSGADYNISAYDLTDATNCSGSDASAASPKGYTNACSHTGKDSAGNDTAWYNYAAATAGTITGYENTEDATQDICPSGWHLPSGAANNSSSELYEIFQSTSTDWVSNTYLTTFNAIAGGHYVDGQLLGNTDYGAWWSTTPYNNASNQYILNYNSHNNEFSGDYRYSRYAGIFVRCIANS